MGPYGTETKITMTKTELLALLFKLNRPSSAKALIRLGEDKKEYYIEAIPDIERGGITFIHPYDQALINKFNRFVEEN